MFQSTRRFKKLNLAVAAGSLLGILACRAALATDIASPASINDVFSPTVLFNATGCDSTYQWELRADNVGYQARDLVAGTTPFIIYPGSDNLFFAISGSKVGIGTDEPSATLHVRGKAQASTAEVLARFETLDDPIGLLTIINNSAADGVFIPKILARSSSQNAALINEALIGADIGGSAAIVYNAARGGGGALVTRPLVVYRNNSVAKATIAANGVVTATSFNPVSSRTMKHDIVDLDSTKATDALRQLTPVEFVYNDDESNEKRVGFIAEDVPEIVAASDRQSVPIMNVVALLTRVVKDQQQTIDEQRKFNIEQQKRMDAMERKLTEMTKFVGKDEEKLP